MKRIIFAVFVILLVVLVSCEKEPKPGPPPVTYTISTTVIGKGSVVPDKLSGIPLGSSSTIKLIPETGFSLYSVKINGVNIEDIQPSTAEVSYTIQNINKDLMVEVVFVETDILILSVKSTNEKPWMLTKLEIYRQSDNLFLYLVNLTSREKSDRYYFIYPSMDGFAYQEDGGVRTGKWDLKQRVLRLGGTTTYGVLELSANKFVFKQAPIWSQADNCYVYAVFTYERN